jgi:predicted Zn-dependent protease
MKRFLLATTLLLSACQTVKPVEQHPLEYTLMELNKVCCRYPVYIMQSKTVYAFVVMDEPMNIRGVYLTNALVKFAEHECELRFIIAHEYGHLHLNQKPTISNDIRKGMEAEADMFAGNLLERSGCDRKHGVNIMKRIYNNGHAKDKVPNYPTLKERIKLILNEKS